MAALQKLFGFLHASDGSLRQKAIRSSMWVGVSAVVLSVLTFARGIILARLLTPEAFGLMAASMMATRLIEILTETGFGAALVHRRDRFEEARDTAFTMMFARGCLLSILSVLIAPFVSRFYGEPLIAPIVAVVGLSFILSGSQSLRWLALQKALDFKRLTYMELTTGTLTFVIAVALAFWLRSVWALVFTQIAAAAVTSIVSYWIVPGPVRFRFDPAIARELYNYGKFITGLAIVVFLTRELDNAVIGKLLGMETLGYYVAAYTLANIPTSYFTRIVAKVLFPMFSQLQHDAQRLRSAYAQGIALVTALAVPVSVTMAVLAPEIINALYGGHWAEAAGPLRVLALFGCFRALWVLNGYLYNAIGRPQIDFYMNLARLAAMGALLLPLTMRYGVIGASVAVTVPMGAQFVVGVYLSKRFIGAPLTVAMRPLAYATAQGAVLAAVLVGVRSALTAGPRTALVLLGGLGGVLTFAFNHKQIRMLLGAHSAR
jgi:O-antigen/teichoic acid export membrane protein